MSGLIKSGFESVQQEAAAEWEGRSKALCNTGLFLYLFSMKPSDQLDNLKGDPDVYLEKLSHGPPLPICRASSAPLPVLLPRAEVAKPGKYT